MIKHLQTFKKLSLLLWLTIMVSVSWAQVNLAPLATATGAPACNTGACSTLNNLNFGTCGTQQMWLTSAASNPGSSVNITFTWTSTQVINKITIHAGQAGSRYLTGGTVQVYNGTTWVNHQAFTQPNTSLCSYDIPFNPVATTAVRIIDMTVGGTQTSNVNFREVEIWQGSMSTDDIGVASIDSPAVFCGGPQNIVARVQNFGTNQVTGFTVNWSLNGTAQTPITSSAFLDTLNGANPTFTQITLMSGYTFSTTSNTIIKAWTSNPNSTTDTMVVNDSATVSKRPSMSGTFTIDPAGSGTSNYLTIDAAIAALNVAGVCGPTVFNIAPGTYTRTTSVIIGDILGASNINTITFDGGNASTCIFQGSIASAPIILMNASKYIIWKNLKVNNTATTTPVGIAAVGGTRGIQIRKCNVSVTPQTGTSSSGYVINFTGSANGNGVSACAADSAIIDSNSVSGGGYGIVHYGSSTATANRGLIVTNNNITNVNYMGCYIAYNYNAIQFKNNYVFVNGGNYGYYGVYFYSNQNSNTVFSHEVTGNKILNWSGYGLYMYYPSAAATAAKVKVYNNVISNIPSGYTTGLYGIYYAQPAAGCQGEFYHNTSMINSAPTSTTYTALYSTGSNTTQFKNNIFAVYGGSATPLYLATAPTGNIVNYNIYYNATSASGNLVYRGSFYTAATYKTATAGGDSSYNSNPSFFARIPLPGDYHLTDGCDGYGTPLAAVATDIEGTSRSTVNPNPGAYEFTGGVANNLRVTSILSPTAPITVGTQDLKFLVKNIGNNTVSSYNASYKNNAGTPVSILMTNTVGVCGTDTAVFTGANQVTLASINQLMVYTDSPNGNPDADKTNDTLKVAMFAPLNGTYTVGGTTPDFPTVAAAASALQYGVAGPVIFDIRPGTYTGQVIVNGPILGSSATNTVTFEGNNNTTRIVSANVSGAAFLINNASYVTVQNLKVINAQAVAGIGVVGAASTYNAKAVTIRKCDVSLPIQSGTSSSGFGIIYTGTAGASSIASTGADSSVIDSNIVTGGSYGIVHYGSSNASYNRGVIVRGNVCNNINYMGGYIAYNYNATKVIGNTFNLQGVSYGYYGLYFYYNQNASPVYYHEVNNNKILNWSGYGIYYYYPASSATAAPARCYNNLISCIPAGYTTGIYGIYLYQASSTYTAEVMHNTILMNGASTSTSYTCLYNTGSTVTVIKNNIFVVNQGSATPLYLATSPTGNLVNYNLYYNATNPVTGTLVYRGANYTPATYKTATAGGDSSFNQIPPFVSSSDFHINNGCIRGVDLTANIPADLDNLTRSTSPNVGCYEYPQVTLDITPTAVLAPAFPIGLGSQDVRVLVRNNGSTTVTSMNVTYRLNGGTPVSVLWTGTLGSCDTTSVYFTGANQINLVAASNTLKVYTDGPNGSADLYTTNDTLNVPLSTPLSGNYIIGTTAPSDFPSFNAAFDAAKLRGIGGPVTFRVRTGTYNEQLNMSILTGANATNNVTFTSMANHRDSVNITFNSSLGGFQYVLNYGPGTSFINFKNMTITQQGGSTTYYGIMYNGNASFDTIENCKIALPLYGSAAGSGGTYTVYGSTISGMGNAFKNNLFEGSYYGVYWYGNSSSPVQYTHIEGNTFNNFYYSPWYYMYYTQFTKFIGNTMNANQINGGTTNYMYFYYNDSGYTCVNNKYISTNISTYWYNYYMRNNPGRRALIANNVITTNTLLNHYYGNSVTNYVDIYNNSYNVGSGYVYLANSGLTDVRIRNNSIVGTSTNSFYWTAAPSIATVISENNNVFSTGSTTPFYSGSASLSLAAWRIAYPLFERGSISANPGYTSNTDLMPAVTNANAWTLNGRGLHLPEITTDINATGRVASPANGVGDIGAYEFTPTSIPNNLTAVPATPVAGGTQVFLYGLDTVAKITYDAFTTAPSTMSMKLYTGSVPPNIAPATVYPYFYVTTSTTASTSYNFNVTLNYQFHWLGNISNWSNAKLATQPAGAGWTVYGGSNSLADSLMRNVTSIVTFNSLPATFTLSDDLSPLPVNLVKFSGRKEEMNAMLSWATAQEKNSSRFEVERSFNGDEFETVGHVEAAGNSNTLKNYSFADENVFNITEVAYYRLKMIDKDGSFKYSSTVVLNADEKGTDVTIFPNPFNDLVYVELPLQSNQTVELRDLSGRVIFTQELKAGENIHQLNIPAGLNKGIYFLVFDSKDMKAIKLMKN